MSPSATVLAYLASFRQRDPTAIAAHVADDFVNDHASTLGSGCVGREEYLRRLPGFLAQFVDLTYRVEQVIEQDTAVAAAYQLTATSDGHAIDVRGVMVFEVIDSSIRRRTDYWDSLGYLRQIGGDSDDA